MIKEPKWISLSERLPEDGQKVIVTIWGTDGFCAELDTFAAIDSAVYHGIGGYITMSNVFSCGYFETQRDWDKLKPCRVIAWMPRPEGVTLEFVENKP